VSTDVVVIVSVSAFNQKLKQNIFEETNKLLPLNSDNACASPGMGLDAA
jgi:hypothetical protein